MHVAPWNERERERERKGGTKEKERGRRGIDMLSNDLLPVFMKLFPAVALIQRELNPRRDTRRGLHYPATNYWFVNGTTYGLLILTGVRKRKFSLAVREL